MKTTLRYIINTIQYSLLLIAVVIISFGLKLGGGELGFYASLACLLIFFSLNLVRLLLKMNLFWVPKDSKYQTFIFLFQTTGLAGIYLLATGRYMIGAIITLSSMCLMLLARYELWDLVENTKSLEKATLTKRMIIFSTVFMATFVLCTLILNVSVLFDMLVGLITASFTIGIIEIKDMANKISLDEQLEVKKIRSKVLISATRVISGSNVPMWKILSITRYVNMFFMYIAAALVGFILFPFYIYLYVNSERPS